MRCPACTYNGTKVLDSRPIDENRAIRRRRECEQCATRFTTFEKIEEVPLIVVKKEGVREEFNKDKILRGLIRACEKRPVSLMRLEQVANHVENVLRNGGVSEISTHTIGEMVMEELAKIDEVAYVRFASVYRQFKDINVFLTELRELIQKENREPRG